VRLDPVTPVPAYELVLEQLRRSIDQGHFAPGEKLPPERDLARQLGVSRTTVREAVRVLEGERAVEVRRGSMGGIIVRQESARPARLRQRLKEFDEIIDFRLAVEPMAARLAAGRRTKSEVAALADALARLDDLAADDAKGRFGDWLLADSDYHVLIGKAARNSLLWRAIETGRAGMFNPVGAVWGRLEEAAHAQHAEIYAAIAAGDGARAAAAMTTHIEGTRADVAALARR
jgi:GntR family transcriptional regulator, transcriptional repressor for pyruvate dehydrogenase complex